MHDKEFVFTGVLMLANKMQMHLDGTIPGLTLKQWLCLAVITKAPTPPTVATIAEVAGTTHQNTSKLVRALENKGYVELKESDVDKRARTVHLTARARALSDEAGREALTALFAGLDDASVATCLHVLDRMSRNLTGSSIIPEE